MDTDTLKIIKIIYKSVIICHKEEKTSYILTHTTNHEWVKPHVATEKSRVTLD